MFGQARARRVCWVVLGIVVGCHSEVGPPDTGSVGVAKDYYEALRQCDWAGAYSLLHPESRARSSPAQFAQRATHYRGAIGFEPQEVHVRAHSENGSEAIVHIVWMGQPGGRQKFYKDAVCLRCEGTVWGIVLPTVFGSNRRG